MQLSGRPGGKQPKSELPIEKKGFMIPYEILIAAVAFAIPIAVVLIIKLKTAKILRPTMALQEGINRRSLDDVKQEVDSLLASETKWAVTPASAQVSNFDHATNVFFSSYQAISDSIGTLNIDSKRVRPSNHKNLLVVGDSFEGDTLLLNPSNGRVTWIGSSDSLSEGLEFTTIFHLVLFELLTWKDEAE